MVKVMMRVALSLFCSSVLLVTALVRSVIASHPDTNQIKQLIQAAAIIAADTYTTASAHHFAGDLAERKAALIADGRQKMRQLFTLGLAETLSPRWIDDQFETPGQGPIQSEAGILSFEFTRLAIEGNRAEAGAVIRKYLVDRVVIGGKRYCWRIEGNSMYEAKLIKTRDGWRIAKFSFEPDQESTTTTRTPDAD